MKIEKIKEIMNLRNFVCFNGPTNLKKKTVIYIPNGMPKTCTTIRTGVAKPAILEIIVRRQNGKHPNTFTWREHFERIKAAYVNIERLTVVGIGIE